jgi:hypothetical protein
MKAGANISGGCVYLNNHVKKFHPQLQEGQATPTDFPPIPDVPLHAPSADPYLTNQTFFESLSLDSHELHQVHGSSITWPLGAVSAIDTTFGRILQHVLTDLDKDAPVAAVLSLPRILCFPPPPGLDRSKLTVEFISRVRRLENGGAAHLHKANDWVRNCPIGEWLPPSINRAAQSIAKSVERRSPSAGFRTITAAPSMPPTLRAMTLGSPSSHVPPILISIGLPQKPSAISRHLPSDPVTSTTGTSS